MIVRKRRRSRRGRIKEQFLKFAEYLLCSGDSQSALHILTHVIVKSSDFYK
jgi:hypothetical protein